MPAVLRRRALTVCRLLALGLLALACGGERQPPAGEAPAEEPPAPTEALEEIAALGYVEWVRAEPAELERSGVTRHDAVGAWPGFNLYKSAPQHQALLLDMHGVPVHAWQAAGRQHNGSWSSCSRAATCWRCPPATRSSASTGTRACSGARRSVRTTTST